MFLTILKIIFAIGIFLISHRVSNGRHIRRRTFPQQEKRGDCRASKLGGLSSNNQWPFQELKLEVPTIYKAYFFRPIFQGIFPEKMVLYGTNVPLF